MPAAVLVPGIVGALGVGASVFGAHKQGQAQQRALDAQERANRQAMAAERSANRSAWDRYRKEYADWYSRFGEGGIKRYGVPTGVDYKALPTGTQAGAAPGEQVTMAGGRSVPRGEYDEYVRRREARRAGGTLGGILSGPGSKPGVWT